MPSLQPSFDVIPPERRRPALERFGGAGQLPACRRPGRTGLGTSIGLEVPSQRGCRKDGRLFEARRRAQSLGGARRGEVFRSGFRRQQQVLQPGGGGVQPTPLRFWDKNRRLNAPPLQCLRTRLRWPSRQVGTWVRGDRCVDFGHWARLHVPRMFGNRRGFNSRALSG